MPKEQAMLINRINIFTLKVFRCLEYIEKVDRIVQNEIKRRCYFSWHRLDKNVEEKKI